MTDSIKNYLDPRWWPGWCAEETEKGIPPGVLVLEGVLDWNWDEIRIGDKDFTTEMKSRFPDDNGNSGKRYRFIIERLDEPEVTHA